MIEMLDDPGIISVEGDAETTLEEEEGLNNTVDDPRITGMLVDLEASEVDRCAGLVCEKVMVVEGDTEATEGGINGVRDDAGITGVDGLIEREVGITSRLDGDDTAGLDGPAVLDTEGDEDLTEREMGMMRRLEGEDTAELDGLGVPDSKGVDTPIERELGVMGRLEGEDTAKLEAIDTEGTLGEVLRDEAEGVGIGVDDGVTTDEELDMTGRLDGVRAAELERITTDEDATLDTTLDGVGVGVGVGVTVVHTCVVVVVINWALST
ncbi:hypothetical protein Plec18167_006419 [Paecilomyces lecythidis]|uniref:Uncharacterized protein n=1 Tax=Paecilomyces lecythidis TaxID=3004212 RepID=A0ABR3XBQ8_9EURO